MNPFLIKGYGPTVILVLSFTIMKRLCSIVNMGYECLFDVNLIVSMSFYLNLSVQIFLHEHVHLYVF